MWELDHKESWVPRRLLNYGAGADSWDSLGLQGDQTSQSYRKAVLNIHFKDWCYSWSYNTLTTWCEELTPLKRPWCWERLKTGEGNEWGWDSCMASPTLQTRVWASSRSWWWTGKPGVLQSTGSQRAGHDWATELMDGQDISFYVSYLHRVLATSVSLGGSPSCLFFLIIFLMKDNCFTQFCWFLSNLSMNQP